MEELLEKKEEPDKKKDRVLVVISSSIGSYKNCGVYS